MKNITKNMDNKVKERLDEVARGVADVTLELLEDNIDWQLADFPQNGDENNCDDYVLVDKFRELN